MPTGSGLERYIECRASAVLPRVWTESSEDATRGTEAHEHLQRVSNGADPSESLEQVDPQHRGAVEAIDLGEVSEELALSAEVTLVYHPGTDTARVLGQSLERDYSGVADDEIAMTIDVAGVDQAAGIGKIRDYKTGWAKLAATRRNWQMIGNSLGLARAFDLDEVDAGLIYLREGVSVRRDYHTFHAADFVAAASLVRRAHERTLRDRETYAAGGHVEPTEGSWCKYCPSTWCCPAKVGLIRAALAPERSDDERRLPLTPERAVEAWHVLQKAKPLMKKLETDIKALASYNPLLLEVTPEGVEVWLGKHDSLGNERLDPEILIPVAAEILLTDQAGLAELQVELADLEVTKKRLDAAIKKRVAKGQGAETARRILDEVRARGGAKRALKEDVQVYKVTPERAA